MQWVERHSWIPGLGVEYVVGVDGLGLAMVALTVLLVPMALLVSWTLTERVPLYFGLVLWLEAGLIGTFTALNFFHWFLFWELCLIPAFFLIRLWGGPDRGSAATQFFVYTMAGSVALLLAFLALFLATGTFDFGRLAELGGRGGWAARFEENLDWGGVSGSTLARLVFLGAFLGFAVKVPVMPFHTWLPSAYAEAPTGTTMLLTGAMSKMGVYGILRILIPLFGAEARALLAPLLWLAVAGGVIAAATAFAQRDLKRMFAYSSVNHLAYCLLGIFAAVGAGGEAGRLDPERSMALGGVVVQMFNHGITAAALFAFVAFLEQRSGGRRGIEDFGGLRRRVPVFCGLMGAAVFASLGLPGLSGFVGEFMIFKGSFALEPAAAATAALGLLLTAVFLLTFLHRVFHGPLNPRWAGMADLGGRELLAVVPAMALMLVIGVVPQALLGVLKATVTRWVGDWGP